MLDSCGLPVRTFYGAVFAWFGFSITYNFLFIRCPGDGPVHEKLYYLTVLNTIWMTTFGLLSVTLHKRKELLDALFASVTLPFSLVVVTMFWALFAIDPELVFPIKWQKYFPEWYNQTVHTVPVFIVFLDSLFVFRRYPDTRTNLSRLISLSLCYILLVHVVAWMHNFEFWVYPILASLSFYSRLLFVFSVLVFSAMLYALGHVINYHRSCKYALKKQL